MPDPRSRTDRKDLMPNPELMRLLAGDQAASLVRESASRRPGGRAEVRPRRTRGLTRLAGVLLARARAGRVSSRPEGASTHAPGATGPDRGRACSATAV